MYYCPYCGNKFNEIKKELTHTNAEGNWKEYIITGSCPKDGTRVDWLRIESGLTPETTVTYESLRTDSFVSLD